MSIVRGEVWTLAGGAGRLSSKPRPVLIVQSDLFEASDFVTVALVTSTLVDSPTRVPLPTTNQVGLDRESFVMADKLHTVPRANLRTRCGTIPPATMLEVERAILVFLGIAR
ncbi:MAG: type II toxin-antitoxin system PemK/MazF family toxin [Micrococcales bacterium]|nr:type II toxin-antitoxin system PemK/MazF family toxin [Micrococcales bacterium]